MSDLWSAEVSSAVTRHMNEDHAQDCLRLVQVLGGRPQAGAVRMEGCDAEGMVFVADGVHECRVAWGEVPTTRAEIRAEVVRLHDLAVAAAPS